MTRIARIAEEAGCTKLQVWTLTELAKGRTVRELADERGVTERGVWYTRKAAIARIEKGRSAAITNRQAQVVQLREQGHSWRYIGRAMSIDHTAAIRLYRRAVSE